MDLIHNKINKNWHLFAKMSMVCILTVTTGCFGLTKRLYEETTGIDSTIKFKVLDFDAGHPMIYWIEGPDPIETALTLTPNFQNCTTVKMFVNPTKDRTNKLSKKLLNIKPKIFKNMEDELSQWQYVSDDGCSALVSVGYFLDKYFEGISFSTPAGRFNTYEILFQSDVAPIRSSAYLLLLPFGPYFDLALSPIFPLVAVLGPSKGPDELIVSFDFPNGERAETKVIYKEAKKALKDSFPHLFNIGREESAFVHIWARAALMQLHLDFKEINIYSDLYADPNWWHAAQLVSVGNYNGTWVFSIDGGITRGSYLGTIIENDAKVLRFRM